MSGTFDKWLSRAADLGQLFFWLGGASILGAASVGIAGYVSGLAPSTVATQALLSLFALLGIGTFLAYWWNRRKEAPSAAAPSTGTVGQLVEQYAVENARRFESEATQLRDDLRETRQSRQELEQQVTTLQQRLDASQKSAREMNDSWSKLAREAIADARKANAKAQISADAIREIEEALVVDQTPQGLLGIVTTPPPPEERVSKAIDAVRKYRNSGLISDFIPFMQALLAKENKPDPTDSGT
jgi:cell division protein FtsB